MHDPLLMTDTANLATAADLDADIASIDIESQELTGRLAEIRDLIRDRQITAALTQTAPAEMPESQDEARTIEARLIEIGEHRQTLIAARDIRVRMADKAAAEAQVQRTRDAIESREQACSDMHDSIADLVGRLQAVTPLIAAAQREIIAAQSMAKAGAMTDEQRGRAIPARISLPAGMTAYDRKGQIKPGFEYMAEPEYELARLQERLHDAITATAVGKVASPLLDAFALFSHFAAHGEMPRRTPTPVPIRVGDNVGNYCGPGNDSQKRTP